MGGPGPPRQCCDGIPRLGGLGLGRRPALALPDRGVVAVSLRPGYVAAPLVFAGLWLAALVCYWYPRRLTPQVVGITTVVTMVLILGGS